MPTFIEASSINQSQRLFGISLMFAGVFFILILRLLHLQVLEYETLSQTAQDNYTKDRVLIADRGTIFDRKGRILATNKPTFDIYLSPRRVKNKNSFLDQIAEILELDALERLELSDVIEAKGYKKHKLASDVNRSQVAAVEALGARLGGLSVDVRYQRVYPEGEVGAHLVGYLGNPTAQEVKQRNIFANQMVGRYGVEKLYDHLLQGEHGVERYVVDVKGHKSEAPWAQEVKSKSFF